MPLVAPKVGLPTLIKILFSDAAVPALDWQLFLWVNNVVPDADSVVSDFTNASFAGYSIVGLSRATWTAPVIVGEKTQISYGTAPIMWTATDDFEVVFGYGIFELGTNFLLVVERFAAPVDLTIYPQIGVLPRVTLGTAP